MVVEASRVSLSTLNRAKFCVEAIRGSTTNRMGPKNKKLKRSNEKMPEENQLHAADGSYGSEMDMNCKSINDVQEIPAEDGSIAKQVLDIEKKQCEELLKINYGKGVPFGHVGYARDWLGVKGNVLKPVKEHPKRPITGLECSRNEVSGDRLWSLLKELSGSPEVLFSQVFLHNYCPIFFLKDSAKNVTPPELKVKERANLEAICDKALVEVVQLLGVEHVVGVGNYAADRAQAGLLKAGLETVKVSTLMHPSPVNPAANKGWKEIATKQLTENGIIHYFKPKTIIPDNEKCS
ncbi:single-strand selective monofunctional uracil DNA glycosylase isoform X3 [Panulirus ornatus]|uniref:single-strand selective monofunctional uracil DNA glycosylase isoform X3 n=1 Tax=Panulirus ornatus TaxID=150431 RepID=UPI003A85A123